MTVGAEQIHQTRVFAAPRCAFAGLFRQYRYRGGLISLFSKGPPLAFPHVPAVLARALTERGYQDPTPVQTAVLEGETAERDLLVSAQTGSGKTVAYGLAMAADLLDEDEQLPAADTPLALIIAPTRELALQVQGELNWLYAGTKARVVATVGGMDAIRERRLLERGAHIVVGTPGRLRDHLERGALDVTALKVAVIDEADEMLDLGFHDDLQFILDATPETRRTMLFSATLPKAIVTLAKHYQRDAFRIATLGESRGHADIDYRAVRIAHAKIERAVVNLLRFLDPPSALVFCGTRFGVRNLGEALAARGFAAVSLSGEMSQNERNNALQALRDGRARVCVATDVAARGIDIANLTLVVHADLPNDAEVLQHRSGRTGRAGRKGVSILLVPPSRRRYAEAMLAKAGVPYTWEDPPTVEAILARDRDRLLENPMLSEPPDAEDRKLADALMEQRSAREIAQAFAKLYRAQLPAPEDLVEYVEEKRRPGRERDSGTRETAPRSSGTREHTSRERAARDPVRLTPARLDHPVWFRVNVGRERNADPKWLLPEICRQGEVTKSDIGAIRVFDTESRFELDAAVAEKFAVLVAARQKGGVRIFPAPDGEAPPPRPAEETNATAKHPDDTRGAGPKDGKKFFGKKKFGQKKNHKAKHQHAAANAGDAPPKRKKKKNKGKPARD
jgi:ATP-dependent RNA helicase DeaD